MFVSYCSQNVSKVTWRSAPSVLQNRSFHTKNEMTAMEKVLSVDCFVVVVVVVVFCRSLVEFLCMCAGVFFVVATAKLEL